MSVVSLWDWDKKLVLEVQWKEGGVKGISGEGGSDSFGRGAGAKSERRKKKSTPQFHIGPYS